MSLINIGSKLLVVCLLAILAGCERTTEVAPESSQEPQVQESTEAPQLQEVTEQPQEALEIEEIAETVEPQAAEPQAPEVPAISIESIPPLAPLPWLADTAPDPGIPELVHFTTDAGDFVVAVYPQAAPNAAERFLHLVDIGYYNGIPVSRVVPGFVAQFGINWREGFKHWRNEHFNDDPTFFAFEPGTLAFGKAGPNTNSTQVFINYANNNRLADPQYNFAVFAQVIDGMEVVEGFKSVGDATGGLNQTLLWDGGQAYLDYLDDQPTMILEARRITPISN